MVAMVTVTVEVIVVVFGCQGPATFAGRPGTIRKHVDEDDYGGWRWW